MNNHAAQTIEFKISERLSALMKAHDLTVSELARSTGLPQPTVYRIVHGQTANPRIQVLKKIADYFCTSVDTLYTDEPVSLPVKVPLLSWQDCDQKQFTKDHYDDFVISHVKVSPGSFALKSTPSLSPYFMVGTHLIIDPDVLPTDGVIVLVYFKNVMTAAIREYSIDGLKRHLLPLKPGEAPEEVTTEIDMLGSVVSAQFQYT